MQQTNNPYASPNAPVGDVFANEGTGDINIFTAEGRLGRIRYFYYFLLTVLGISAITFAMLLLNIRPTEDIQSVFIFIAMIVLTIQRCHDLNISGWWSLLVFVPLVSFYFFFAPGTKGANRFGAEPRPNSKAVIIGAILLAIATFILIGIPRTV